MNILGLATYQKKEIIEKTINDMGLPFLIRSQCIEWTWENERLISHPDDELFQVLLTGKENQNEFNKTFQIAFTCVYSAHGNIRFYQNNNRVELSEKSAMRMIINIMFQKPDKE